MINTLLTNIAYGFLGVVFFMIIFVFLVKKVDDGRSGKTTIKDRNRDRDDEIAIKTTNLDMMDGREFEFFCARILEINGYMNVSVTKTSGDQGVDIIAEKDGIKCAVQCKRYSQNVGNKAVQEVIAGTRYYNCAYGIVITNSYFTKSAKELAKKTNVILWDRNFLMKYMNNVTKQLQISPELEQQGKSILQEMVRIYTVLFQENMHVNVLLEEVRYTENFDIEIIFQCENDEQAQYLVSKESFLTEKLCKQQHFTKLSNNYLSVLIYIGD